MCHFVPKHKKNRDECSINFNVQKDAFQLDIVTTAVTFDGKALAGSG